MNVIRISSPIAPSGLTAASGSVFKLVCTTLAISAAIVCNPVAAEKADKAKPVNIESDRLTHDDIQQVSVYTGRVILTKGTIIMKGDRLVIRQDPEGYQYGVMTGKLASFRQKRELPNQFIEGYGSEINYDGKNEVVKFIDQAYVRRLDKEIPTDEIRGSVVIYEARTENYAVEGSGGKAPEAGNPSGRVRVTIQPKNAAADGTSSTNSTITPTSTAKPTADLKPTRSIALPPATVQQSAK